MSLTIHIPATELWDPGREQFIKIKEQNLLLEHSLVSMDKSESKWKKPFLTDNEKTAAEILDYIRCMTITKNVDPYVYFAIPPDEINKIKDYMSDPMTATTITDHREGAKPRGRKEIITSEIIYWQMTQLNIPLEWEKRHLNKLLMLIQVGAIKSEPPKSMSKNAIMKQNSMLNAARRKKHGTRG